MLSQMGVIDAVVKVRGQREWKLVLEVNRGEWALPRAVNLLEDKLNTYASYALDGKMVEAHPNVVQKDIQIVVASVDPLPEKALWLLEKVKLALRPNDIQLFWDAKGGAPEGGTPPPPGTGAN
jgi:hypothetical protein